MGSRFPQQQQQKFRNPCLTMHQPWASLLVYGIKRIEGRSWPAPIRGRLWIHAAGKVPEPDTIRAMEEFYREIYAVDGITDLKFPEHYPVSRLLGCVNVVGCVRREELTSWKELPEGVRLEGQTEFCWVCEDPKKLIVPFEMRGFQGVYNLENKIFEAAVRGLSPVTSPLPARFPLPNPSDPFSLKPGSISPTLSGSKEKVVNKPPSLDAAIAGARAAATQFSKQQNGRVTSQASVSVGDVYRNKFMETSSSNHDGIMEQKPSFEPRRTRSSARNGDLAVASSSSCERTKGVPEDTVQHQDTSSATSGTKKSQHVPQNAIEQHSESLGNGRVKAQSIQRNIGSHQDASSYKILAAALKGLDLSHR